MPLLRFLLGCILLPLTVGLGQPVLGQNDFRLKPVVDPVDGMVFNQPVHSLLLDQTGFLWVGTQTGLWQYDGTRFSRGALADVDTTGLTQQFIRALAEDSKGRLWIGTTGSGLFMYDPHKASLTSYTHDASYSTSVSANPISALLVDKEDHVWIGTSGGGLNRWLPHKQAFEHIDLQLGDAYSISDILEDDHGSIWVATAQDGLFRINPHKDLRTEQWRPELDIIDLAIHGPDGLWVATANRGVFSFNTISAEWTPTPFSDGIWGDTAINAALSDGAGRLWVGPDEGGLAYFDSRTGELVQQAQPSVRATRLMKDRNGTFWVASMSGLFTMEAAFFHPIAFKSDLIPFSENATVLPVLADGNRGAWFGTDGEGLGYFDASTGHIVKWQSEPGTTSSLQNNHIFSLLLDNQNRLWVGTYGGGLHLFDRQNETFTRFLMAGDTTAGLSYAHIWPLLEATDGTIWAGTHRGGLLRFDPESDSFSSFPELNDAAGLFISSLTSDDAGHLWIGTSSRGIVRFHPDSGAISPLSELVTLTDALQKASVFSLHVDPANILWAGTLNGGLLRCDVSTNDCRQFTEKDGLPHATVLSIRQDDAGLLWLSSDKGLTRFNPDTFEVATFSSNDGLHGNQFRANAAEPTRQDVLHFGGIGGFTYFAPAANRVAGQPPPLVLTEVKLFDAPLNPTQPAHLTESISLPYTENGLDFSFALLDYARPDQHRYRYRLEGWDQDWVENGHNTTARFRSLGPDRYTFRVQAFTSDGQPARDEIALPVIINPPFWQRGWFLSAALILAIGLIYSLYRYRLSKMVEMERMRMRIASDLHDEVGANLSSIAMLSELLQEQRPLSSDQTNRLERIQETAFRTVDALREVIWIIDPKHDSLNDMIKQMRKLVHSMLESHEVTFEENIPPDEKAGNMEFRRQMFLAFKETIHNIYKHAQANKVHISISKIDALFTIEVQDNGIGLPANLHTNGRGLRNMQMRMEGIQGRLSLKSEPASGTTVVLQAKIA